jgi:hypothetical protein
MRKPSVRPRGSKGGRTIKKKAVAVLKGIQAALKLVLILSA